jgi:hypothetical protein
MQSKTEIDLGDKDVYIGSRRSISTWPLDVMAHHRKTASLTPLCHPTDHLPNRPAASKDVKGVELAFHDPAIRSPQLASVKSTDVRKSVPKNVRSFLIREILGRTSSCPVL